MTSRKFSFSWRHTSSSADALSPSIAHRLESLSGASGERPQVSGDDVHSAATLTGSSAVSSSATSDSAYQVLYTDIIQYLVLLGEPSTPLRSDGSEWDPSASLLLEILRQWSLQAVPRSSASEGPAEGVLGPPTIQYSDTSLSLPPRFLSFVVELSLMDVMNRVPRLGAALLAASVSPPNPSRVGEEAAVLCAASPVAALPSNARSDVVERAMGAAVDTLWTTEALMYVASVRDNGLSLRWSAPFFEQSSLDPALLEQWAASMRGESLSTTAISVLPSRCKLHLKHCPSPIAYSPYHSMTSSLGSVRGGGPLDTFLSGFYHRHGASAGFTQIRGVITQLFFGSRQKIAPLWWISVRLLRPSSHMQGCGTGLQFQTEVFVEASSMRMKWNELLSEGSVPAPFHVGQLVAVRGELCLSSLQSSSRASHGAPPAPTASPSLLLKSFGATPHASIGPTHLPLTHRIECPLESAGHHDALFIRANSVRLLPMTRRARSSGCLGEKENAGLLPWMERSDLGCCEKTPHVGALSQDVMSDVYEEEAAARFAVSCWNGFQFAAGVRVSEGRGGEEGGEVSFAAGHFFSEDAIVALFLSSLRSQLWGLDLEPNVERTLSVVLVDALPKFSWVQEVVDIWTHDVDEAVFSVLTPSQIREWHEESPYIPRYDVKPKPTSVWGCVAPRGAQIAHPVFSREGTDRYGLRDGDVYLESVRAGVLSQASSSTLVFQEVERANTKVLRLLQAICAPAGVLSPETHVPPEAADQSTELLNAESVSSPSNPSLQFIYRDGGQRCAYEISKSLLFVVRDGPQLVRQPHLFGLASRVDITVQPGVREAQRVAWEHELYLGDQSRSNNSTPSLQSLLRERSRRWKSFFQLQMTDFRGKSTEEDVDGMTSVPTVTDACGQLLQGYFLAAKALFGAAVDTSISFKLVKLTCLHAILRTSLQTTAVKISGRQHEGPDRASRTCYVDALVAIGLCDATLHFLSGKTVLGTCVLHMLQERYYPSLTTTAYNERSPVSAGIWHEIEWRSRVPSGIGLHSFLPAENFTVDEVLWNRNQEPFFFVQWVVEEMRSHFSDVIRIAETNGGAIA